MTATKESRFRIESKTSSVTLNIEPEGALFDIESGAGFEIRDRYDSEPVTIRIDRLDDGRVVVTVWPGDGDVTVLMNGEDVLTLENP